MKTSSYITVTDQFCGAGGSSLGATAAGAEVRLAMNHWPLAIETHNTNFPHVDHDCTDISAVDPRRYPSTNVLITSPECTNHTIAKGKPRQMYQRDIFGNVLIDPAEERSRATMWDVPRFAEYHDYEIIIVENVVDAGKWRLFDSWLHAMHALDYQHQVVYFNSMFAYPTPQSRDRMYTIFWKRNNTAPNLDIRPLAPCPQCGDVEAIQTWKKQRWGRYRAQYFYRCPTCHRAVEPYYHAAINAIDFSITAERIGDRAKPLRPKTLARIQYGLENILRKPRAASLPFLVETQFTHAPDNRVTHPMHPLPAQTGRQSLGVAMPFFIKTIRQENMSSFAVPGDMPLWTQTTCQDTGIVMPDSFLTYYYGSNTGAQASTLDEVIDTVTTGDRVGLVSNALESLTVDDLTFRMLQPHEIGRAMAFPKDYQVKGNGREQVKQYGNAVTPPAMKLLMQRCIATLQ